MSLIFNEVDLTEHLRIKDIRKSLLPFIENTLRIVPGKHGVRVTNNRLEAGCVEVDVRIKSTSKEGLNTKIRVLAECLYTPEPKQLILPDESGRYYMAILDRDTNIERTLTYGDTTLFFLLPDPIAYGETKTIDLLENPASFENSGTEEATGIITIEITEATDHIQVTLLNTGESVYLEHDFIVGDVVKIDLGEETAYKNDYPIMRDCHLESDFFNISVGEVQITVSSGTAVLVFTERWL